MNMFTKSLIIYKSLTMQKIVFMKMFALLCMLAGGISTGMAQTEMHLSLDSARHYALEHNRNLLNAGLAIDEAEARLKETIAQGLPQVNATVDYSNFFGSTATLGAMPGFEIEFNPTSNLAVSFSQLVFSGSYIVGVRSAKLYKEITETSLEQSETDILAQVTQAYYLSLISEKHQSQVAANLVNLKSLLDKTRAMVDVGIAEEVDYDQLSVQVVMLEDALRAAGRQVTLSLNMLRMQMGLHADIPVVLTDELESIVERSDFEGSLVKPFSIGQNPNYRLMALQTDMAEKQVNMERAAYLPTIAGFYNFTEKLLKPEFDITPNHVIGLNVSIPIFSSGARRARVNQARINLQMAENQKALLYEQLMIREKQLRYNLNNALEQYESQKTNMLVAKRVYDNINNKYQQGLVSSLDLTTANNNYLQAGNSYISATLQLLEAHLEMDRLLNSL